MKTTVLPILVPTVPGYAELQREMHNALRAQHPEWIETDGESPTCDYYESVFAQMLVSYRADARVHFDDLLDLTRTERPCAAASSSISVGDAVQAVNELPITPEISHNSIMGERGRGDTPNSSDGVMPYRCSHLDGAESDLVVPSDHGAQYNPQAIREVARILKENLTVKN